MRHDRLSPALKLFCTSILLLAPHRALRAQDSKPQPDPISVAPAVGSQVNGQAGAAGGVTGILGTVSSGKVPLPGVTITITDSSSGKRYPTSTDAAGNFSVEVGGAGHYAVKADLAAFAPATGEAVVAAAGERARVDLSLVLLSRAQAETRRQLQQREQARSQRGMQSLSLTANEAGDNSPGRGEAAAVDLSASMLPNAGLAGEGNTESVAISGAAGRSELPSFDPSELQDRMAELRDRIRQGGGGMIADAGGGNFIGTFGGGGMGGPGAMTIMMGGREEGGGGGGRGFRNFRSNQPHGSIFYSLADSALDATPFSVNGHPQKPDYLQNRFGASVGGPLNIPHVYNGGTKTFLFVNYSGSRAENPYDVFSTVPTLVERSGDFSQSFLYPHGGTSAPIPVQIYSPSTQALFANNTIPANLIDPTSAALLRYIPLPNLPGSQLNFHQVVSVANHSDTGFVRLNHTFGPAPAPGRFDRLGDSARGQRRQRDQQGSKNARWRQSINGGFNYSRSSGNLPNPFPALGGTSDAHSYNLNAGYNLSKNRFSNSLRFTYNRSRSNTRNQFTDTNNIAAQLGISGASQLPAEYGLPNIAITNYQGINDTNPQLHDNQTYSIGEAVTWSRGKHSFNWGGDYRRLLLQVTNAANARGSLTFSNFATALYDSKGNAVKDTGYSFADFLLGSPALGQIQAGIGNPNYQFSASSFDLFVRDNWRTAKNLTLDLGLRYEYTSPYAEAHNQLANLDVAPALLAGDAAQLAQIPNPVVPVEPGGTGPYQGTFPSTLVRPDRNNFAPRVGIAWRTLKSTVIRAGYGINYNLGQYGNMVTQLAFQPPFAVTETNIASPASALTYQNALTASQGCTNCNNYAVDPNYRLAYVQTWNLNLQRDLGKGVILNTDYTGSKGTRLDIVEAPNRAPSGPLVSPPVASAFNWETSEGSSTLHAGSLRVRKRTRQGFSLGGTYVFSKSIDNASSVGGGGAVVAQDARDLAAERGLSSFDQRHRLTADYMYELPFGPNRRWANGSGWQARAFGGIQWSGSLTLASGFPYTVRVLNDLNELKNGTSGTLRANYSGAPIPISGAGLSQWFNTAAFSTPASGTFGDAGRNTVIGPGSIQCNMAFSKTINISETQGLELRISANNVFNHVNFASIDTTLGSNTFGRVLSAGSMRKLQITARYRF